MMIVCPHCSKIVSSKDWRVGSFNCPYCKSGVRICVKGKKIILEKG